MIYGKLEVVKSHNKLSMLMLKKISNFRIIKNKRIQMINNKITTINKLKISIKNNINKKIIIQTN